MQENTNTTETAIDTNRLLTTVFRHRLTGEKLKIKKLKNGIATCESEITTVITEKPYLATNTAICSIENLIPCIKL